MLGHECVLQAVSDCPCEGGHHHGAQSTAQLQTVALDYLVVVAEFRDALYPGLVSTGKAQRGGDKPFHTVIMVRTTMC